MGPTGLAARRRAPPVASIALAVTAVLLVGFAGGWLAAKGWVSGSQPGVQAPSPPRHEYASQDTPGSPPFAVFVSSHPTETEARQAERSLQQRGYAPFMAVKAGADGERTYWVFAGRFRDLQEARRAQERLASQDGYPQTQIMRWGKP